MNRQKSSKPNWEHLKKQINLCSCTGFFELISNHLKGSRKGLRPVPQTFSMIFKKFSKTAHKPLVKLNIAPIREIIMKTQWFFWRESTYSVK